MLSSSDFVEPSVYLLYATKISLCISLICDVFMLDFEFIHSLSTVVTLNLDPILESFKNNPFSFFEGISILYF